MTDLIAISPSRVRAAVRCVAFWHGVAPREVLDSAVRRRPVVVARHDVIRSVYEPKYSVVSIARAIGVHHTSALYALGKAQGRSLGSRAKVRP